MKPTYEQLYEAARLVADDRFWYFCIDNESDELVLTLLCSDTFGYAVADGEDVPWNKISEVKEFEAKCRKHGAILWVQEKRQGMGFISQVRKEIAQCTDCHKT